MVLAAVTGIRRGIGLGAGMMRRLVAMLGVFGLVAIAACTPVFTNSGYVPTDAELAAITPGTDTRDTVAAAVGRPSTSGVLNDQGWYFVQSRWKEYGPRARQEVNREVVAVSFDEAGVVTNIERFGLDQGRVVVLSRRVTSNSVQSSGFLRQLLGNIGNPAGFGNRVLGSTAN